MRALDQWQCRASNVYGYGTGFEANDAGDCVSRIGQTVFAEGAFFEQKVTVRRMIALETARQTLDEFTDVAGGMPPLTAIVEHQRESGWQFFPASQKWGQYAFLSTSRTR